MMMFGKSLETLTGGR